MPGHLSVNWNDSIWFERNKEKNKLLHFAILHLQWKFQWPCGLWPRSAAAWLLRSRFRIPLRAWIFVCYVFVLCCVGSGLCHELIPRSEEFYLLCVCVCVYLIVCDLETTTMMRPMSELGCCAAKENKISTVCFFYRSTGHSSFHAMSSPMQAFYATKFPYSVQRWWNDSLHALGFIVINFWR
jgi:hypothetical protein